MRKQQITLVTSSQSQHIPFANFGNFKLATNVYYSTQIFYKYKQPSSFFIYIKSVVMENFKETASPYADDRPMFVINDSDEEPPAKRPKSTTS